MGTSSYDATSYGNPYVDALISGYRWRTGDTVTYYLDDSGARTTGVPTWQLNGAATAIQSAAAAWNAIADIHYTLATSASGADYLETLYSDTKGNGDGTITLGEHYYPNHDQDGGTYNVGSGYYSAATIAKGGIFYETFLHELGHGLGLEHPFDETPVFPGVTQGDADSVGDNDLNSQLYTVMSYNDFSDAGGDPHSDSYGYAETPMAFDVAAIQALYGANMATAAGNNTYSLVSSNGAGTGYTCIWDAGGTDTISAAGTSTSCTIDLRAATLQDEPGGGGYLSRVGGVYGGFTIAHGVTIENAVGGSGDDTIVGNDAGNRIDGGNGDDVLTGGGGADTFVIHEGTEDSQTITDFVTGVDHLDWSDTKPENIAVYGQIGGQGTVAIQALDPAGGYLIDVELAGSIGLVDLPRYTSATFTLTFANQATFHAAGGSDNLTGSNGDDHLYGGSGDDTITGGGGHDALYGEAGNDTLSSYVDGAQVLDGGDGDDSLSGGSGATLIGGTGDDTYGIGNQGETIVEEAGGGNDTVYSSIDYTLPANVEALVLEDGAEGSGNDLDNTITASGRFAGGPEPNPGYILHGLGGNDTLIGAGADDTLDGGSGRDTLSGGNGNDTYIVDSSRDTVTEAKNAGTDTVDSYIGWTLGDNLENLLLIGTRASSGTGNALANTITGNDAANAIFGMDGDDLLNGGAGNDTLDGGLGHDLLAGGAGDDTYLVDSSHDQVSEAAGSGNDTVEAAVGWTLGDNLENLVLTGSRSNAGTGNALDNAITGNDAANALSGLAGDDHLAGGNGDDTLLGGDGNDTLDGGLGHDLMQGGAGDDLYIVDSSHDRVSEAANAGTDEVHALASFTLGANIENLVLEGTSGLGGTGNELANTITGNAAGNTLSGLDGDDRLVGNDGADHLLGGAGNDVLDGGLGHDVLEGGAGDDVYIVDSSHDQVVEAAGAGHDRVESAVSWTLADALEDLTLTGGADLRGTGNAGANALVGNAGANSLSGLGGDDSLAGGGGADTLFGGDGNDVLTGGLGRDLLTGGAGSDRFVFTSAADFASAKGSSADEITDFATGDRIDLSALDAVPGGADDAFRWIGTADYDGRAGEIRMYEKGDTTYLQADLDGDKLSDFSLKLDGLHALTAADFVL